MHLLGLRIIEQLKVRAADQAPDFRLNFRLRVHFAARLQLTQTSVGFCRTMVTSSR